VEEAELPELDADLMAAFAAECAITHMAWFPRERERYGPDLRLKLDDAQGIRRGAMAKGPEGHLELRKRARSRLDCDVLVGPVRRSILPGRLLGTRRRAAMTRWTRPFNFLGWPAIAVGGLQIVGRDRDVVLPRPWSWRPAASFANWGCRGAGASPLPSTKQAPGGDSEGRWRFLAPSTGA